MSGDTTARFTMTFFPSGNCMSGCLFSLAWVRSVDTVVEVDAGVGGGRPVKNQHDFVLVYMNMINFKSYRIMGL